MLGIWWLASGEVLLVEATPPKRHYWNFQLGNVWAESLDSRFQRVHINRRQAVCRDDDSLQLATTPIPDSRTGSPPRSRARHDGPR